MAPKCCGLAKDDTPCNAAPLHGEDYCLFHHPDHVEEVQNARRAGGQRRRRQVRVATSYDFPGLNSLEDSRRLMEHAAFDTLALPNSPHRNRLLLDIARHFATLHREAEIEERLAALEAVTGSRPLPRR
jgi:hypothetical protein